MKSQPTVQRRGSPARELEPPTPAPAPGLHIAEAEHAGAIEDITGTESWNIPLAAVASLTAGVATRPEHLGRALPLLRSLARDPRLQVRQQVAGLVEALAPLAADGIEELLEVLCRDPYAELRDKAVALLGQMLQRTSPLRRTQLVCEWAVSANAHRRQAIARVLPSLPPTAGAGTVVRHLGADPVRRVRDAARRSTELLEAR